MPCPCLLSACCMLGSNVRSPEMGTWERWAGTDAGAFGGGTGSAANSPSLGEKGF